MMKTFHIFGLVPSLSANEERANLPGMDDTIACEISQGALGHACMV